jgi:prepilin-type N-terminal cleavage/methylation domain-containing protein
MRLSLKRGFTLIELLVVIAIIAILAAILFPVFAKARDRAQTTACMNNMKQIGTAVQMYLGDSDGKYPMNRLPRTPGAPKPWDGSPYNWHTELTPYVKSTDVGKCPTNPLSKLFPKVAEESGNYPISYSYNGSMFHENSRPGGAPTTIMDVKDPSGTLLVVESRGQWPDLGVWGLWEAGSGQPYRAYLNPKLGAYQIHDKRMNGVFADTHAKSVSMKQTLDEDMWKDSRPEYQGNNLKAIYNKMLAEYR